MCDGESVNGRLSQHLVFVFDQDTEARNPSPASRHEACHTFQGADCVEHGLFTTVVGKHYQGACVTEACVTCRGTLA